ncbi:Copper transport protein [Heracleum sosnowskyi]|uniref:Copper transport protein n=1 Tax=Heracleum sosnowskyi TaxID=360622 RepID=A0AAD8N356_9APIA|nr:Copper transport protein [Heracleum sosnowskyi]
MENMHGGDMPGMSSPPTKTTTGDMNMHSHQMMHMTFFWGKNALILFPGWPGSDLGKYILALILVFVLAILVEWLSHCNLIREDRDGSDHVVAGLLRTLMHMIRVGLAYLVMLALMSFNVGVFLVAVLGHAVGFLLFGSRVFKKHPPTPVLGKTTDLPPMTC